MRNHLHILRRSKDFFNRSQTTVIIKTRIKYISLKLAIFILQKKKRPSRLKRQDTKWTMIKSRKDSREIDVYIHTHTQTELIF